MHTSPQLKAPGTENKPVRTAAVIDQYKIQENLTNEHSRENSIPQLRSAAVLKDNLFVHQLPALS